jgi:Ran GTPase-activating protein (RanGAP) involved in mRNA processing and transport
MMKGLETLDLQDNNIGAEGAKSLAEALKEMKGLSLDLQNNNIGEEAKDNIQNEILKWRIE